MEEPSGTKEAQELWDEFGIIVLDPKGKLYTNQVGGYACRHPEESGSFQKLDPPSIILNVIVELLLLYFTSDKWRGWCSERIDEDTALVIDSILKLLSGDIFWAEPTWRVDRSRMTQSMEAWIYVENKALNQKGVFVFPNSD